MVLEARTTEQTVLRDRKTDGYKFLYGTVREIESSCIHRIEIFRQRGASNVHHNCVARGAVAPGRCVEMKAKRSGCRVGMATGTGNGLGIFTDTVLAPGDTERYKEKVWDFTLMGARQPLLDHSIPALRRLSGKLALAIFAATFILTASAGAAFAQEPASQQAASDPDVVATPAALAAPGSPALSNQAKAVPGTICGSIIDVTGAPVVGAKVTITRADQSTEETFSDENGRFTLGNVKPGEFQLTISSPGFTSQGTSGLLHDGENYSVPQVALTLATEMTEVHVNMSQIEIAEAEIKEQEKQRVLGFVPNFYVSYVSDAAPLTAKQKFELAWKTHDRSGELSRLLA